MKTARTLGAVGVLACLLTACAQGNSPAGGQGAVKYASDATFTEPIGTDPGNLNPLQAVAVSTNLVDSFAYDSLIDVDLHGNVVSRLATKWNATPTTVTFTLRSGVTCTDGAKLTASDVAANFSYAKNPKNHSTVIGDKLPSPDFTAKANDQRGTITVTVSKPYGFLLQGAGLVPIVCPKGLANPSWLARHTDGTGPFTLTESVADDHYTFTVRKGYRWGPNGARSDVPGFPAKVVFRVVQSEATMANLLLSGQLNDAAIAGPDRKRLMGHGFQTITALQGPTDLWFNQRAGHPGADPAVRKALIMATDLDQLTKVVTQGTGSRAIALSVLQPRPCRANTVRGTLPAHDLAAAKTVLDQAGWVPGADGVRAKGGQRLSITLLYPTVGNQVSSAMELLGQWWKQAGAEVNLKGQNANAYQQSLFQGAIWDATALQVAIPFPSQFMPFASGPPSPQGQNFAAIANADYARLAGQALATPGQAGCDLWARAEQALFRNADVVPVADDHLLSFASRARYSIGLDGPDPTSIRMLAG